jgi:hypothetical protein
MDSIVGRDAIPILKPSGLVSTSAVVVVEGAVPLPLPLPLTTIDVAIGEDLQALDGIDPDDIRFDEEDEDVDDDVL